MKKLAFALGLGVFGCGAAPAPDPIASSPTAPIASVAPSPTSSEAASASTSAPVTSAPPSVAASASANADPPPPSPEEQKKLEKTCKPLVSAMQRATQKAKPGTNPLDLFADLMKKPPAMADADRAKCAAFLERSIRDYLAAAIETEAHVTLKRIAAGMLSTFADKHAFCPATAAPIPASAEGLVKQPYVSTPADWSAPTWQCLHFDMTGQAQRFQYEVRVDPAGAWFEAIARGAPRGEGRLVEIVQRGEVQGDKIALPPQTKR